MSEADIEFRIPRKLAPLRKSKKRFRVIKGGRGGAKSEFEAGDALIESLEGYHKYLCVREIQKSIGESVYATLEKVARRLGIHEEFEWLKTSITAKTTGSIFIFGGLSGQTAESLKSIPDVDRCWVEEGQSVSSSSWAILKPTVFRNPGAVITVTMNPRLESDAIYADLVASGRDDVEVVTVNLDDNPWATEEQKAERDHDFATDPVKAEHIWGGALRPSVEGAIYGKEMARLEASGRLGLYPHSANLDTIVAFDLGGSSKTADHTSFVLGQHVAGERRICMAHEDRGQMFSYYLDLLKRTGYRIDKIALPHDARNHSALVKGTIEDLTKQAFPNAQVVVVPRTDSVASDINFVRERFDTITIDREGAKDLVQALRSYRWDIKESTGLAQKPLHDTYSDTADAFRYWMMQEAASSGRVNASSLDALKQRMQNLSNINPFGAAS